MSLRRNYGIDLLRIILTFMICVLHTLGRNEGLLALAEGKVYYPVTWLMEILCYCAVDGYALITGYTSKIRGLEEKPYSYSRLFDMWLQVFFYSFVMSAILLVCGVPGDMSVKTVIKSALPLSCGVYWYFTAYAFLYIFKPYIDTVLEKLDDAGAKRLLVILLLFFCGSGILMDAYKTDGGYSGLWISVLYVIGHLMKRVKLFETVKSRSLVVCWLTINVLSLAFFLITGSRKLITYISPITVFSAIFLVVIFSRVKANAKIVSSVAPFTFGIYLCQSNPIVGENTVDLLTFVQDGNVIAVVLCVLGFATALFVAGLIVDWIRFALFKALRMHNLAVKMDILVQNITNKFMCILSASNIITGE